MLSRLFQHHSDGSVFIRLATDHDILPIADITKETYSKSFVIPATGQPCFYDKDLEILYEDVINTYPDKIRADYCKIYVACCNSKVIGYAKVDFEDHCSFLDRIYVLPNEQGVGAGTFLFQACLQSSLLKQKRKMRLEVWEMNTRAISYYEKNEFTKTDKTHEKRNSIGEVFRGFEMICSDVASSLLHLAAYIETKHAKCILPSAGK